ncbi:acyltransferase 3, partial [Nannochloropsis oceanica]
MRATPQRSRLCLLLSSVCLLLPALATTSEVLAASAVAHPTTPALYTHEGPGSDNRPALPTLWSGILDLSKPCQQELMQLESRLAMNDTMAFTQVAEALFSSGRVMEGLFLVNAGIEAAKTAPPPTAKDQELALLNLIAGFPLISLGSSDACGFVTDFQYCHVDVATIYLRFGLCVPAACNAQDIQLGLNATYFKLTKSYLDSSLLLADTTVCGNTSFPWTTGTYVMIGVCFVLLALVAAGTALEYATKRAKGEAKRRGEDMGGMGVGEENRGRRQVPASVSARLLLCFSLLTNWRLLFAKARGGPFDALDGIRTLSMCWVIFGHTFIFALFSLHFMNFGTEVNGHDGKGFLATYPAQAVTGGYFAVDTFFFLSAFLAVFFMLEEIKKMQ